MDGSRTPCLQCDTVSKGSFVIENSPNARPQRLATDLLTRGGVHLAKPRPMVPGELPGVGAVVSVGGSPVELASERSHLTSDEADWPSLQRIEP